MPAGHRQAYQTVPKRTCRKGSGGKYSEVYGACAIARVVRSKVVFPLARMVLKGVVREGDVVRIRIVEDKLTIEKNHAPQEDGTDEGIGELEELGAEYSQDEGLEKSGSRRL